MQEKLEEIRKPTTNARPLDWGPHPPRRLRKAKDIHAHMSNPDNWQIDGESISDWFIVEEVVYWYNSHHRYDITSNWLANVFCRNPRRFQKGHNVARKGFQSNKVVALWKAI